MKKLLLALAFMFAFVTSQAQTVQVEKKIKTEKKVVKPAKKTVVVKQSTKNGVVMKKDGTPDRRYKESRKLKKDGTLDMRYKENRKITRKTTEKN